MHSKSKAVWSMLALAAAALFARADIARANDLKFCIDKASPAAAVDARLGQAVGRIRGAPVRLFYYAGLPKGDDKDNFDLREYKDMLAENCDLVLGFPHDAQGTLPAFLHATQPYASTGFVLVTPKHSRYASLERMPQGTHVAVAYNTYANYYFRNHHNIVADIVEDDAAALQSIARHEVAGALLWRPAVAQEVDRHHAAVAMHQLDEAKSRWNLVALYTASGEAAARDFEAAIAALRANGALERTLGSYASTATLDEQRRTATRPAEPAAQSMAQVARKADCGNAKKADKPAPALYTEAQATAGKQLFADKCALCHGPNLEGRAGPALKGKMFLSKEAAHTVAEIFRILAQNMPAQMPGTLSHDEYVKIMSFLLQQNGYPAGTSELVYDAAMKSKTPMVYRGE